MPLLDDVQQGVLYKRRDVFKNNWRPRWFVLQPEQGIMTYYLLNPAAEYRANSQTWRVLGSPSAPHDAASPRGRTTSVDSNYSENSVDYDVVPRGTIYLMGCTVRIEEGLSRPAEDLYAFSIAPPSESDAPYFLAATSPAARMEWFDKISVVCRQIRHRGTNSSIASNSIDPIMEVDASTIASATNDAQTTRAVSNGNDIICGNGTTKSTWRPLDSNENVFAGVPATLSDRIQNVLRKVLPLTDDSASDGWSLVFQDRDGVTAHQRRDAQNHFMIKSEALLNHHPKQVFNLLVDIKRRQAIEKNIQHHQRLLELNNHNFLDYYAYHPVWPTTGRDFAVVAHWQVLQRGTDERAILIMGCSCPEAEELKPPTTTHVRATLFVTLTLLKVEGNKCQYTRLLSYDLEGSLPRQLTSTIMQRQAIMPALLANHLSDENPEDRLTCQGDPMTNEIVIRDVLNHLRGVDKIKRQHGFDETLESLPLAKAPVVEQASSVVMQRNGSRRHRQPRDSFAEILVVGIIIMSPVILYYLTRWCASPKAYLIFLSCSFVAIREVFLRRLGTQVLPCSTSTTCFVCRLTVDLNGVLRFISAAKNETQGKHGDLVELSVVHILVAALVQASGEETFLACKRWRFPWLVINGYFKAADDTVDVTVMETGCPVVTLRDVAALSIYEITEYSSKVKRQELERARANLSPSSGWKILPLLRDNVANFFWAEQLGQFLILSSPGADEYVADISMANLPNAVNVAAVVGGIKLVHDSSNSSSATLTDSTESPVTPPKPVLSLSLTICAQLCQIDSCRRLAERVQTLVENPELCTV